MKALALLAALLGGCGTNTSAVSVRDAAEDAPSAATDGGTSTPDTPGAERPADAGDDAGSGSTTFAARCGTAGVLKCVGWDSPADFALPARTYDDGIYPAGDDKIHGQADDTIKASGAGSLRFEILSNSDANVAGYWLASFGKDFGAHSTFYVQFQQRFSPEFLTIDWSLQGTSWKQFIMYHVPGPSCATTQLVGNNYLSTNVPMMYTECGARSLFTNGGVPPLQIQQGDYNCWYKDLKQPDCLFYQPNKWMTFYYRIQIGDWGQPNSHIQASVAVDGGPYKKYIDMPDFVLNQDGPGHDFNEIQLTPYMTGKDTSVSHPTAYTWYDELIISTAPIAAPGGQ